MFEPDSLYIAVSRAEAGDTILLSSGQFPKVTIDKTITLRGEGMATFVNGIDVAGNTDNPISPCIESLKVVYVDNYGNKTLRNISLTGGTDGMVVKQCEINQIDSKGMHLNITLDRCRIEKEQKIDATMKTGLFRNVLFNNGVNFSGSTKDITFVNCDIIGASNSTEFKGTMINTYLYAYNYYSGDYRLWFRHCAMINCLLNYVGISSDNSTVENCYNYNDTKLGIPSKDFLIEKGYLGNDGTVVGIDGGVSPFNDSYNAGIPRVSSSKITLDNVNKVLNIDVTFESN